MARGPGRGGGQWDRGRGGRGRGFQHHPGTIKRDNAIKPVNAGRGQARGRGPGGKGRGFDFNKGHGRWQPNDKVETEVRDEGMLRHHEVVKAHNDAISAIVVADESIYTGGRDKMLKRWKPTRAPTGRFELACDLEVPVQEQIHAMVYVGEWLFCGLQNGDIRGFSKSGVRCDLRGHTKRVAALIVHQNILVSGSSDHTIRCWQAGQGQQPFTCTHKVDEDVAGPIVCLCALGDMLWAGTSTGVCLVELANLKVKSQLMPKKFVSAFLLYNGCIICGYIDGSIIIFDETGSQKHAQPAMPAGSVLSLAGLESGPRVLVGHSKGQVSSIALPLFHLKKFWQSFGRFKVQCITSTGADGMFLMGAENGTLQLWQRDDISADL